MEKKIQKEKVFLVTVGTTKFEDLIKSIDIVEFYKLLDQNNFTKLIIQKGFGDYIPNKFKTLKLNNLNVEVEQLLPNFESIIKNSEYIISHGGAGNVLEALQFNKKIFVVVNNLLMDNHQVELAEALSKDNYIYYIRDTKNIYKDVSTILECTQEEELDKIKLKEYPNFNLEVIPNVIYEMLDI